MVVKRAQRAMDGWLGGGLPPEPNRLVVRGLARNKGVHLDRRSPTIDPLVAMSSGNLTQEWLVRSRMIVGMIAIPKNANLIDWNQCALVHSRARSP